MSTGGQGESTAALRTQVGNQVIELDVQGMTCASCAARIEKKLNKLDGVQASVNYATEKAHVVVPAQLGADDLILTVQAAGYDAALPTPEAPPRDRAAEIKRMARAGTRVVHCPSANMKLGSGFAPVPEMLAMGLNVALGTDGAASNNNLNMFEEMHLAEIMHDADLE